MRIIAGKHKGLNLSTFELSSTRPTSDMVREALFDKIGLFVDGSSFLDLFAGTGAVGLEALSRGASKCVFIDNNNEAIKIIRKNLDKFDDAQTVVLKSNFSDAILDLSKNNYKFDFVFVDPPYSSDFAEISIEMLIKKNILNNDAIIIWEHSKDKNSVVEAKYKNAITKKYGDKFLTYIYLNNL